MYVALCKCFSGNALRVLLDKRMGQRVGLFVAGLDAPPRAPKVRKRFRKVQGLGAGQDGFDHAAKGFEFGWRYVNHDELAEAIRKVLPGAE